MHKLKKTFFIVCLFCVGSLSAQEVIDQIVAVVGDEIILKSEIETQALQMRSQGYYNSVDINCDVLEEMLFQKLLLKQAQEDSLEVTPAEVDNELERRLSVFINRLGSEKKMEEFYGKSMTEIRSEFRGMIKDQILTQRMQGQLTSSVSVTPADVKRFFNALPADSIPFLPASYQLKQITVYPKISEKEDLRCKQIVEKYRQRVLNGDNFSTLAILYSDDPGSAPNGGELGFVSRTDLVPEFASAAFNLKNAGDISRVVKTEFGYHVMQLIERKGKLVNVRHILVSPKNNYESDNAAKIDIDKIRESVLTDTISFEEAAGLFSEDENSANSGGTILNPMTGKTWFDENQLDPLAKDVLKHLSDGEISKVVKTRDNRGKSVYKFFKLVRRIDAHKANIKDDYQRYQEIALAEKQQKFMENWINTTLEKTYIRIDPTYANCKFKYAQWAK